MCDLIPLAAVLVLALVAPLIEARVAAARAARRQELIWREQYANHLRSLGSR